MMSSTVLAILVGTIGFVQSDDELQSSLILGNSEFGHDISAVLYEDSRTNIWISPFSITSCFSLIYPGSAGNTQSQIADTLGYPLDSDSSAVTDEFFDLQSSIENMYNGSKMAYMGWGEQRNSIIGIANKIFSSKDLVLKSSYISALDDGDESFIESDFDFGANNATDIINDWVYDNTAGLIDEIVSEDEDISNWKLAALNAIYLNATFKFQFKEHKTSKHSFYDTLQRENVVADCHLMHQMDYFEYFNDGNYQFLKFPFEDDHNLFALFALPVNSEVYSDNNGLISDWNVVNDAISNLESTYIALALPKLSIDASYTLKEPLQEMGMVDAFEDNADFSGMSNASLKIDSVIHKTMVEMDEKGLVAAAVTMIGMVESLGYPGMTVPIPVLFKADHSFQLFIIDGEHENTVLFMGQINDPGIPEGSDEPSFDESSDGIWNDFSSLFDLDDDDRRGNRVDEDKEKRDNMATIAVVVILVVSIAVILIWYFACHKRGTQDKGKEVKNFVNLGNEDELELGGTVNVEKKDPAEEPLDEESNTNLIQLGQNVR